MSFDTGIQFDMILADIAGIVVPIALYGLPVYFSWRFFRKQKYRIMLAISVINWIYLLLFLILPTLSTKASFVIHPSQISL